MKYQQLIPSCKKAIEEGYCTGCQELENPYYRGNPNCRYNKIPTAKESIKVIHKILGMGEQMRI